ncbi:MAG: hypothetical protein ILM98_00055 [Kiritimatiellae bacterium]|nr:hypothetical protein [Kiritimatiellia bacterium]
MKRTTKTAPRPDAEAKTVRNWTLAVAEGRPCSVFHARRGEGRTAVSSSFLVCGGRCVAP